MAKKQAESDVRKAPIRCDREKDRKRMIEGVVGAEEEGGGKPPRYGRMEKRG